MLSYLSTETYVVVFEMSTYNLRFCGEIKKKKQKKKNNLNKTKQNKKKQNKHLS